MRLTLCSFSILFLSLCSNIYALETTFQDGDGADPVQLTSRR